MAKTFVTVASSLLTLSLLACNSSVPTSDPQPDAQNLTGGGVGLTLNAYASLQVTTPGFTNRSVRHINGLAYTEVLVPSSSVQLKKDASFRIVRGLADGNCYSFQSLNFPNDYLRHSGSRIRKDSFENSDTFKRDATWCSRVGLSGVGVSFESLNFPGRYLRHIASELWLAQSGGPLPSDNPTNFNQDASWNVITPWWKNGVDLPLEARSLQVTTPGLTNRYLRHFLSQGFTEAVTASSDSTLKSDASWRIVTGLADPACYSLQSANITNSYLRHSAFRLRIDPLENSDLYRKDATFCAQPGLSGTGVSLESLNLPGQFIRHASSEVWLSSGAGARPSDGATGFAQDASWNVAAPWSTATGGDVLPPAPAGRINLRVLNATNGAYPSDQIYWAVIGFNPANNALSYVNPSGNLIAANPTDNDAPGRLTKNGINYANYFNRVSEAGTITLPKMYGARMFLSVGTPMFIKILGVPGGVGFAGPDINNPTDPNSDVLFDFTEFTYNDIGFFGNTTRVDQFGFPLRLRLVGFDGFDRTLGENVSRAQIFSDFGNSPQTQFRNLVRSPYRIVAPKAGDFAPGRAQGNYFDGYINQVWDAYRSRDLVVGTNAGTFRGRVSGNDFVFSKNNGPANIVIRGKPTTQNVFEANGPLASGTDDEKIIEAQIAAALNRHLLIDVDPAQWSDAGTYYRNAPANFFAKFWHDRSIDGLAYGFAYDDVRNKSTLLQNTQPRQVDVIVAW
jgi:Beta-1,3-glucanase/Alpha-L-arabinofuranosidase B (ABFB) domain